MSAHQPLALPGRPVPAWRTPGDLDDLQADLAAEITARRHLAPVRPRQSYVRSQTRPGGRFPAEKPADRPAARPRTTVMLWTLPSGLESRPLQCLGPMTGHGTLAQRWHHQPPERMTITYREHAVTAAWRVTPVHNSDPCELIVGPNVILSAACDPFFQARAERIRVVNP